MESVQAAELEVHDPASRVRNRTFLQRAAKEYWRVITRFTLGLIRVTPDGQDQCVVLLARPLVLLRFHSPKYRIEDDRGSVTWRIKRGILVARNGRDRGFLRLSLEPSEPPREDGRGRLRVQIQVHNFYPWLRGSESFARVGAWIYSQTQQRVHRFVTRAFLRRLARALES